MINYSKLVEIRWSDLDPNFHVRHSVYYDFGAFVRMSFLTANGLDASVLLQHHLGPILFREECQFKREIHFGDEVSIDLVLICTKSLSAKTPSIFKIPDGNKLLPFSATQHIDSNIFLCLCHNRPIRVAQHLSELRRLVSDQFHL